MFLPIVALLRLLAPSPSGDAVVADSQVAPAELPPLVREPLEGGEHVRWVGKNGPVHVWVPDGYDPKTAGTVLYAHGYYIGVDQAWVDHDLAAQFRDSRQNALFVVPESPASRQDKVPWRSLWRLLSEVAERSGYARPKGPVVVMAHSGGYRSVHWWLKYKRVQQAILVDGLYRYEDDFAAWLDAKPGRQLVLIADDTKDQTEAFVAARTDAVVLDEIPRSLAGFSRAAKRAPVVSMRSQYGHMELVTDGVVIPLMLRRTKLRKLPEPAEQTEAKP